MRIACRKCRQEVTTGTWSRFLGNHIKGGDTTWYHGPVPKSDTSNEGACGPCVYLEESKFDELVKQGVIKPRPKRDYDLLAPDDLLERDAQRGEV